MKSLTLILVSLLAVSAAGQTGTQDWSIFCEPARTDTPPLKIADTLHDPSAAFDTLYWRFRRGRWDDIRSAPGEGWVMIDSVGDKYYCHSEPRWLMREGRWDTLLTTRCDTVWVTVSEGQPEHSAYQRVQTRMIDCRDSVVVTPKPIRWDCPELFHGIKVDVDYGPPVLRSVQDSAGRK